MMPNFHTDLIFFWGVKPPDARGIAAGVGSAHDAQRQSEEEGPELCQQVAAIKATLGLEVGFWWVYYGLIWFYRDDNGIMMGQVISK